uniref:sterile alpha motif domain-containing protein 1-like isoform X2 n=1 Tax=Callithrix jacchus TaxID=9483 RepID=UPI0023DD632D|nr:sterile alpha motif domain-containing protein 1-like isoform X2 [Callithrix jacchus]
MLARGGGDGVTEEYGPANKERVPARRPRPAPPGSPPRPGRHGARCGRRPKDSALPGPARVALTSAPGPAAAPLARPQPAPSHGPTRPTLAPRGPYLLAADAAVHRPVPPSLVRALAGPSPSQKAPPRPRSLAAYATGSPAARGAAHCARRTATAAPADCPRPTATAALGPGADFPDFPERIGPGAVAHACNPSTLGG